MYTDFENAIHLGALSTWSEIIIKGYILHKAGGEKYKIVDLVMNINKILN